MRINVRNCSKTIIEVVPKDYIFNEVGDSKFSFTNEKVLNENEFIYQEIFDITPVSDDDNQAKKARIGN